MSDLLDIGEVVMVWPSASSHIPQNCAACGRVLKLENLFVDDGCPCNSSRGVNFTPLECPTCKADNCVKPGHRLYALFGVEVASGAR